MLCVAALLIDEPLRIKDVESMKISYPDFLEDLDRLLNKRS